MDYENTQYFQEIERSFKKIERCLDKKDWGQAAFYISSVAEEIALRCSRDSRGHMVYDLLPLDRRKEYLVFLKPLLEAARVVAYHAWPDDHKDHEAIGVTSELSVKPGEKNKPNAKKQLGLVSPVFNQAKQQPSEITPVVKEVKITNEDRHAQHEYNETIKYVLRAVLFLSNTFHDFSEGEEAVKLYCDTVDLLSLDARLTFVMGSEYSGFTKPDFVDTFSFAFNLSVPLSTYRDNLLRLLEPKKRFYFIRKLVGSEGVRLPFNPELTDFYYSDIAHSCEFDIERTLNTAAYDILRPVNKGEKATISTPAYKVAVTIMNAWANDAAETSNVKSGALGQAIDKIWFASNFIKKENGPIELLPTALDFLDRCDAIRAKIDQAVRVGVTNQVESLLRKTQKFNVGLDAIASIQKPTGLAVWKDFEIALFASPVAAKPIAGLENTAKRRRILAVHDEASVRKQLTDMRSRPLSVMEFGEDVVGAIGDIALASLHSATATTSMESPVRSMADFLEKFSAAKQIIKRKIVPDVTSSPPANENKPRNRLWSGWRKGAKTAQGDVEELRTLADASGLASEAGHVLKGMIPSLVEMETQLYEQLGASYQLVGAYAQLATQIDLLRKVGNEILTEWKQEVSPAAADIILRGQHIEPNVEPFHIQCLAARLEFLEQLATQVNSHHHSHMLHVSIEWKQQQGLATLRGQNIPIIVEQVAVFIRQLEELQRAGIINSLANATNEAMNTEQGLNVLAVVRTVEAIENLADSTRTALTGMSRAAEQITSHMADAEIAPDSLSAALSQKTGTGLKANHL